MPGFSFAVVTKPVKKSYSESISKYNIIVPNTEGTVIITIKGEYKVRIGDVDYDIATECYSCKNVAEIYEQGLTDNVTRVRYIRSERDRDDRDRSMYLPFTAGCSVKGNIVRYKAFGTVIFKIKKVFINADDPIAKEAIKFYRDHYNTITKAIRKDMIDTYVPEDGQEVHEDLLVDQNIKHVEDTIHSIFSIVKHKEDG